ncbi:thermonuclease family protein [Porticoccaceae bacterium LTM1]|nr:thermonuclease family protein [Porticoccaceae bacterium LTM1]
MIASRSVSVHVPASNIPTVFSNFLEPVKKSAAGLALGAFFMLCGFGCSAESRLDQLDCPVQGTTETVTINKVYDGDTVKLGDGRKVRLIGINTPELGRDGKADQPFALEARQQLSAFLGEEALLVTDQELTDHYGRTLAHIYNLDGKSAEAYLLSRGLGWHVVVPPNLSQADCLANAEKEARQKKLNLWSANGIQPVPASTVSEGGFQRIQGKVTGISFTKNAWWINFGEQIAAVIYREHQHRFDRKQLEAWVGREIEVRGWVYPSRSKKYQPWRVKLETPYGFTEL